VLQAHTGSGKTLAYALPILARIDPKRAAIQAVIVVPTRELGLQVVNVLRKLALGSPLPISCMPVVEGTQNRRWQPQPPPHTIWPDFRVNCAGR
jgi:superfamily II DNA/RNA helicase